MTVQERALEREEIARLGKQVYQSRIRALVEAGNHGKIVAIDINSGDFEVADDVVHAAKPVHDRNPGARVWLERIGYRAVHRIGFGYMKGKGIQNANRDSQS